MKARLTIPKSMRRTRTTTCGSSMPGSSNTLPFLRPFPIRCDAHERQLVVHLCPVPPTLYLSSTFLALLISSINASSFCFLLARSMRRFSSYFSSCVSLSWTRSYEFPKSLEFLTSEYDSPTFVSSDRSSFLLVFRYWRTRVSL